ncbi:hypothetical protein BJX96DRAFT_137974 [Aspergillus floccosus]
MTQEMETFAARLASFDLVLNPGKRRSSSTKSAKKIAWPHRKPSPAELAHAGFFYNPYETNPDNTTCFMCQRALDGWEEEDNPITEHLKHAKDCGWAVMMDIQQHSSNPAEIDDPTSDRVREARLATFGTNWPHDGKRGWVCDSEKMVDGGWFFCPTEESNDLASCAYCKLSLDGWEPQDDPFDEHYRRSPDCSFFVFAQAPGKKGKAKGSRSKRGRPSKASLRMSTQSTASEAPVSDMEDVMDQSIASQASTRTKGTKKSSKSKSKTSKSKKEDLVETGSQMDVDKPELVPQEPPKPKRGRGKKRTSDDVEQEERNIRDASEQPERPSKKRATKTRNSSQQGGQGYESVAESQQDESILQEETQKSRAPPKKRGRKPSSASTSRAASVSHVLRDSEIDAALEAELDIDETEPVEVKPKSEPKKKSTSTKSRSKKKQKATPEPEPMDAMDDPLEEMADDMITGPEDDEVNVVEEPMPKKTTKLSKRGKTRSSNNSDDGGKSLDSTKQPDVDQVEDEGAKSKHMSVEVETQEPKTDPELELAENTTKKSSKKKTSAEKNKKSKKTAKAAPEPSAADEQPEEHAEQEVVAEHDGMIGQDKPENDQEDKQESHRRRSSKVPPKTAKRLSDIPQERLYARSLASSRNSDAHGVIDDTDDTKEQDHEAVSPLPSASKSTPSLSPQSSDAENHPPSMKPAPRPHAASPSKQQPVRIPLAPSTPSPSKRNANGGISTSHPWKPIDIDELILANSSDAENIDFTSALNSIKGDLTSPEKKMSVEEWIAWNAKNGEERLKHECERLVGQFEREGARAMRVLEGIECID